jgi:hypothetical protein
MKKRPPGGLAGAMEVKTQISGCGAETAPASGYLKRYWNSIP